MSLVSSLRANAALKGLKLPVGPRCVAIPFCPFSRPFTQVSSRITRSGGSNLTTRQFSSILQGVRQTSRCGLPQTYPSQRSHLSTASSLPGKPSASTLPVTDVARAQDASAAAASPEAGAAANTVPPQLSTELAGQSESIVQSSSHTGFTDAVASIPEPLHFGDLAELGLGSLWTPAGLVERMMEMVNVTTGLPWFYTIIVGSVLVRLSTFYFTIQQTRMTSLVKNAPQIEVAKKKLEEAKETRDQFKVGMAGQEMQKAYKDAGVSMAKMVIFPLIQLPPAIGLFLGVKHLCALPVEQLTHSGFSLIPDLTLISGTAAFDPYYILPLIGCVALNAQLKLSMRDLAPEQTMAPHVMNAVRVASPIILYFSAFFPAGLLVSISTGIGFSLAQAAFFRNQAIRRKLALPYLVKNTQKPPSLLQSFAYGAKQANERGWGKQALSLFKIPGLGEATATPVTSAAATQLKGKVAKTARSRAPKGNFMERPAPQK